MVTVAVTCPPMAKRLTKLTKPRKLTKLSKLRSAAPQPAPEAPRAYLFITEWFDHFGLKDEHVAGKISPEFNRETVFRWRTDQKRLNPQKIETLAKALGISPEMLWRKPGSGESIDAMLADHDDEVKATASDIVRRILPRQ